MGNQIITRSPHDYEISALRDIWCNVFGNIGVDMFFKLLFNAKHCIVSLVRDTPAAMGYLVPAGDIYFKQATLKCAMIYSIATLPKYRGFGLGTAVVRSLINLANELDYDAVVLCPSNDELFEYYSGKTKMCDWFYVDEITFVQVPSGKNIKTLVQISASEYHSYRKNLLSGVLHIDSGLHIFEYQAALCSELGGGLFLIDDCCAVVECQPNGEVWVKELLMPVIGADGFISSPKHEDYADIAASIAINFPAEKYIVRKPAQIGRQIGRQRRFGMLTFLEKPPPSICGGGIREADFAPWYGLAFD